MRNLLAMGVAMASLLCAASAEAQAPAKPATPDPAFAAYAKPQTLVAVQPGRKLHILCMGQGSPTVILTAGLGDWAAVWRKVQPAVSRKTRVCAWDRAGFGYSSPSAEPQDITHTTADLEAVLKGANIRGPYVIAGHSLGGYESLLFADRHPKAVVGMVLVDPSVPDQHALIAQISQDAASLEDGYLAAGAAALKACASGVRKGALKPGVAGWADCVETPPDALPVVVDSLHGWERDPARFETQASLSEHFADDSVQVINTRRRYGAMPLIVLTAGQMQPFPPEAHIPPAAAAAMAKFMSTAWPHAHDQIAALSTRGQNRMVADSSHYIELIRPDLVIAALNQVVDQARAK